MAYNYEKSTGDIVINGWENGVSPSPHKGLANIQNANIYTETGEVMCSFNRVQQSQIYGTGTLTQVDGSTVSVSGVNLQVGSWIHINNGGTTGLSGDYYYASTGKLSSTYINTPTHPTYSATVSLLVVAGGGSGGVNDDVDADNGGAGGGGAGGYYYNASYTLTNNGSYSITVGTGGVPASGLSYFPHGNKGNDSLFGALRINGGGYGGGQIAGGKDGLQGGSGGGGGGTNAIAGASGPAIGSQGYAGGVGTTGGYSGGGGGGGAGGVGANGRNASTSGWNAGGAGVSNSITGGAVTYCAGGRGTQNGGLTPTAVTANTGSGGDAAGFHSYGASCAGADGIVVISYPTGSITATGGTMTTSGGNTIHTFKTTDITPFVFTVSLTPTYVSNYVSGITAGNATFTVYSMGKPIQSATETYGTDLLGTKQYRYYILDDTGYIWVHDTATLAGMDTPLWFLPDLATAGQNVSGLAVLNGWLSITTSNYIQLKPTCTLGKSFQYLNAPYNGLGTTSNHVAFVGHQARMFLTDGNFIASLTPATNIITGAVNTQSYCTYTASPTAIIITQLIGGSSPSNNVTRLPVVFFTDGTLPLSIIGSPEATYYLQSSGSNTYVVYDAFTAGNIVDMESGAVGNQYFNSFYPVNSTVSASATLAYIFTPQRLNLPFYENAQCMAELGNTLIVGGSGNVLYPWDMVSPYPGDLIPLPENNVTKMVTVNSLVYALAGQKGNIYLTNGSSASLVLSIPDYCAGVPGTPATYIEPYFTWGDIMYLRGRVYVSILDQTATKAGNCGGIWSFTPTNNFYVGQDVGQALRLENQNSYGTYNGASTVLLPSQQQKAIGPQYWAGWYSSTSSPLYGIDFTGTVPVTTTVIETDLIPTGTVLQKKTFQQLEYKLATPLAVGESIIMNYRLNGTDAWASCGTAILESTSALAGYFDVNFQNTQWLQLQITLNSLGTSSSSFCRLREIRLR